VPAITTLALRPRSRSSRPSQLADLVPLADRAGDHHLGIEAPQPQLASDRRVDEPQGVGAEAGTELGAARVGDLGDLDDGAAQRQAGAGGQVSVTQVEVEVQLVARQRTAVGIDCDQRRQAGVDHVELHVRVGRAIGRPAASPALPGVAHEPGVEVEDALVEDLTLVDGRPSHDELDPSHVAG